MALPKKPSVAKFVGFISKEILTIREAVWLTDNTYKYEDLVRMMGEIISALEGKIRTPTLVDYKDVLSNIAPLERKTLHLCSYICELSLLYTDLSLYSPAQLATAALLLAKILHRQGADFQDVHCFLAGAPFFSYARSSRLAWECEVGFIFLSLLQVPVDPTTAQKR